LGYDCFRVVVTKDVPKYALMAGVPGKQIGFVLKDEIKCNEFGRVYHLKDGELKESEMDQIINHIMESRCLPPGTLNLEDARNAAV
jgi:hypothetical protein